MDDWTIKVQPPEKVTVLSFIRLFMMARVLKHCIVSVDKIKQMVTTIHDLNLKQQQVAQDILTQLINNGIKKYMKKWFNEKERTQLIEVIFNRIILKQFEKEYHTIVKYKPYAYAMTIDHDCTSTGQSEYYQSLVFNTDDLMCSIFQFILLDEKFRGDLMNCSLVKSLVISNMESKFRLLFLFGQIDPKGNKQITQHGSISWRHRYQ